MNCFLLVAFFVWRYSDCCWVLAVKDESGVREHLRGKRRIPRPQPSKTPSLTSNVFADNDAAHRHEPQSETRHRFVIQGVSLVQARCKECYGDLRAEQDYILDALYQEFGTSHVHLVYRDDFLVNAQFVDISTTGGFATDKEEVFAIEATILRIPGVRHVTLSRHLQLQESPEQQGKSTITTQDVATDYVNATEARREYCVTGKGIRVAILDTGIDYTHEMLGGPGTSRAFQAAYGRDSTSVANSQRDGMFPTSRVVEGYDFVGEGTSGHASVLDIKMDDDPIDYPGGHGTRVASCILAVAPEVEFLAVKVCSIVGCPEYSLLAGISFAVQHGAQIINLSMGTPYVNSYYSVLSHAAEEASDLGIVVVVSAGNHGNIPFVMGDLASTNNAITVGATDTIFRKGYMADFSSRGIADGGRLKPDLSAPGGSMVAAAAGSGMGVMETRGSSFSCPFVTGAVALILEHCPECSPFAVKALLMNNASRNIKYLSLEAPLSPLSLSGSGQLHVARSLKAGLWVYCAEDTQPSISLGIVDAFKDMVFHRTLRLNKLLEDDLIVTVRPKLRDPSMAMVLQVKADTTSFVWSRPCESTIDLHVSFHISALHAPDNHLASSGQAANDPNSLDIHEFDGWIVIEYGKSNSTSTTSRSDIGVPFHAIIRKASELLPMNTTYLPRFRKGTKDINVNLLNNGVGTAQVDVFELLHISGDDEESVQGSDMPSADLNYIGFRSIAGYGPDCDKVLEFAFHLWEKHRRLVQTQFQVQFDLDRDGQVDFTLANLSQENQNREYSEGRILETGQTEWKCSGFVPDHGTNSATTILRVCSNDVGIESKHSTIDVNFLSFGLPNERRAADKTPSIPLHVPKPILSAPSYDIPGGNILATMKITAERKVGKKASRNPLGLLLITNSWRGTNRTGAATARSEAIAFTFDDEPLPNERTPDFLKYTTASDLSGPRCRWSIRPNQCTDRRAMQKIGNKEFFYVDETVPFSNWLQPRVLGVCMKRDVPRLPIETLSPSATAFLPTYMPSASQIGASSLPPSSQPSESSSPSLLPSAQPTTTYPSMVPSANPIYLSTTPTNRPNKTDWPSHVVSFDPTIAVITTHSEASAVPTRGITQETKKATVAKGDSSHIVGLVSMSFFFFFGASILIFLFYWLLRLQHQQKEHVDMAQTLYEFGLLLNEAYQHDI